MSVILHLSDTHFGTEQPQVATALLQLAHEVRPDLAILSGDVTQRARRAQFSVARSFLDSLAAPVKLVIPGNHDIPLFNIFARAFNPYGNYRRALGRELAPQFSDQHALVIGVNTTRPWRHADGEVSARQIERVSQQLKGALPGQLRVVAVHQPVYVERESDKENLLHGHRQAIEAWAAAGADLILSGHIHLAYIRNLQEKFQNVTRPVWIVSAGTAVSKRIREGKPNSVNLIRYEPAQRACKVERMDFDAASSRFIMAETRLLALS
ncbi:MAG: metallophosphoesterase [Methylophilus sp.]|uniref:metallophosphoesterase family protein n=1 Tax=Methylophilus sp. TaxID=29541 RepID=UPI002B79DB3A|nr:metallophosphoesterase [Methylophilus sp.]HSH87610.1 metallophosphoesterase [Methylophilus sp.]